MATLPSVEDLFLDDLRGIAELGFGYITPTCLPGTKARWRANPSRGIRFVLRLLNAAHGDFRLIHSLPSHLYRRTAASGHGFDGKRPIRHPAGYRHPSRHRSCASATYRRRAQRHDQPPRGDLEGLPSVRNEGLCMKWVHRRKQLNKVAMTRAIGLGHSFGRRNGLRLRSRERTAHSQRHGTPVVSSNLVWKEPLGGLSPSMGRALMRPSSESTYAWRRFVPPPVPEPSATRRRYSRETIRRATSIGTTETLQDDDQEGVWWR